RDARALTVGMAGPQAESVTFRDGARLRTVPTVGDQGAYLIVQRGPARGRHAFGSFEPLPAPGGGAIVRIDYRNGQVCRIRARLSIRRVCPLVGYAPAGPRLTHADVATPVSARLDVGPHGGRSVVVSFVARAAVTNASAAYQIELRLAGPERNCRGREVGPLLRDVRAGARM